LKTLLFFEQSRVRLDKVRSQKVLATESTGWYSPVLEQYAKHVVLVLSFNEGLEQ